MQTVSRIPTSKHGTILKNPGFTGKNRPVIKIKAVMNVKKTSKGGSRYMSHRKTKSKSKSKKGGRSRVKRGKKRTNSTRKQRK